MIKAVLVDRRIIADMLPDIGAIIDVGEDWGEAKVISISNRDNDNYIVLEWLFDDGTVDFEYEYKFSVKEDFRSN